MHGTQPPHNQSSLKKISKTRGGRPNTVLAGCLRGKLAIKCWDKPCGRGGNSIPAGLWAEVGQNPPGVMKVLLPHLQG